jgi:hypothetical protein
MEDEKWHWEKFRKGEAGTMSSFCTQGLVGGDHSRKGIGRRWWRMNTEVIRCAGCLRSIETEWNGIGHGWRRLPVKQGTLEGLQAPVVSGDDVAWRDATMSSIYFPWRLRRRGNDRNEMWRISHPLWVDRGGEQIGRWQGRAAATLILGEVP